MLCVSGFSIGKCDRNEGLCLNGGTCTNTDIADNPDGYECFCAGIGVGNWHGKRCGNSKYDNDVHFHIVRDC